MFTEVGRAAGIAHQMKAAKACSFIDIDNDGDPDLFVTEQNENKLFINDGHGKFTDVTRQAGIAVSRIGLASSDWADYDGDGDLDLLLAIDWWGVELYRNDGGRFTRVTTTAFPPATDKTPGAAPNNPMGVTWGDFDNDGCIVVFITGMNFLGQGGFESRTLTDVASRLYRNNCNGTFTDVTTQAGLSPTGVVEWSANFVDFDNDGDLDLAVVAGNVPPENPPRTKAWTIGRKVISALISIPRRFIPPHWAAWGYRYEAMIPSMGSIGPSAAMPNFLYKSMLVETGKATFVDVTGEMGVGDFSATQGSAWADFDNDGALDWFVPNKGGRSRLFHNNGPVGNYQRVHLVGNPLRDAVGARIKIKAGRTSQIRYVHVLDGYLSQSQMDPHFGLGKAEKVDEVWVRWPNTTTWMLACSAVPANRKVTITQGGGCRWE